MDFEYIIFGKQFFISYYFLSKLLIKYFILFFFLGNTHSDAYVLRFYKGRNMKMPCVNEISAWIY